MKNNSFEFYLYQESNWNDNKETEEIETNKINFANKVYKLYVKNESSEWVKSDGLYATDANGMFTLHTDEKAVFEDLPDASSIIVEEEDNIFWESTINKTETTTKDDTTVYTHTVSNRYRPILYLQKQLKSVPDGLDVSNYEFTFQILADGESLANTEYWYVDKALTNGGIPNKIGTGTTDKNGCVKIKAGQIIAISPGKVGTSYEVTEIAGATDTDNWICENKTVKGTVALNGSLATITNVYRLKDLYITKEITHQDAEDCNECFTFKITDAEGNPITGNNWVLLDSNGNETDTKGTLNENGEFEVVCAGQTVKVEGFKANETYIVQETESGELYKPINDGIAEVTMPLYSSSANVTVTNDWQKRPLSVSKVVMYDIEDTTKAEAVAEKSFTMTATVNGQLVADYPYTVVDKYGNSSTGQTNSNGQFQIKNGETVTFEDIGIYGESFTITETPDSDYPQIYPANAAPYTGTLSQDENKVCFVNGSGKNLIISKQYVGNDAISNRYVEETKTDVSNLLLSRVNITLKYKDTDGITKVWPETDTPVQVVALDGSVTQKIWSANSSMSISEWVMVVIPENAIPSDAVYYVSESEKNQHRLYYYSYRENDGSVKMYYLEINQKVPENYAPVTGTIESNPFAMIINEVKVLNVSSVVEKRMSIGSDPIPTDARLVWRVERYTDGKWQPAENIKYIVNTISVANREIIGDKAMYTGSDGIIELTKKANHSCPIVKFIDSKISINVQDPVEGQLRVIELQDESDDAWGMLAGYGNADDLSVTTNLNSENAVAFVNSNVNTPVEIEKTMGTDCDETFAMTLRQVVSSSEYPITKTEQITETVIRVGIPYIVYDSETGDKVSEEVTDKDGNIYLKAGQFARLELPDSTVWTVSEETNPQYKLKSLSSSLPEEDERLAKLSDNLMLIKQQYPFVIGDIAITDEMVEEGYVYDGETGKKVILNTGDVTIPEYIIWNNQKYRVTSIAESAFEDNTDITSITLPKTLKTIESSAFCYCENLKKVNIKSSLTSIGSYAFTYTGLTEITIPDSVTSIGDNAFQSCDYLTSITIPNSVKSIGTNAFRECYSLDTVTIENGVESIGNNAFQDCDCLISITIPDSVKSIGEKSFYGCESLESVAISGSVESIGKSAFANCTKLTDVTINDGITSIGSSAFYGCESLKSITIPSSVESIGSYAFADCSELTDVTIKNGVTSIGSYAFSNTALTEITIPSSVESIGSYAFFGCGGSFVSKFKITINKAEGSISGSPWGATFATVNWTG